MLEKIKNLLLAKKIPQQTEAKGRNWERAEELEKNLEEVNALAIEEEMFADLILQRKMTASFSFAHASALETRVHEAIRNLEAANTSPETERVREYSLSVSKEILLRLGKIKEVSSEAIRRGYY